MGHAYAAKDANLTNMTTPSGWPDGWTWPPTTTWPPGWADVGDPLSGYLSLALASAGSSRIGSLSFPTPFTPSLWVSCWNGMAGTEVLVADPSGVTRAAAYMSGAASAWAALCEQAHLKFNIPSAARNKSCYILRFYSKRLAYGLIGGVFTSESGQWEVQPAPGWTDDLLSYWHPGNQTALYKYTTTDAVNWTTHYCYVPSALIGAVEANVLRLSIKMVDETVPVMRGDMQASGGCATFGSTSNFRLYYSAT